MKQIALKKLNQISHIALDIETIPNRRFGEYEPIVQEYIKRKIEKARATDPSMTYEKFSSLSPTFGRIVCVSLGYLAESPEGKPTAILKSFTGTETEILQDFSRHIAGFANTFVHYNGRSFDVPFILARLRQHKLPCVNRRFADLAQQNGTPHLDLMEFHSNGDANRRLPLAVLAALNGLPISPLIARRAMPQPLFFRACCDVAAAPTPSCKSALAVPNTERRLGTMSVGIWFAPVEHRHASSVASPRSRAKPRSFGSLNCWRNTPSWSGA